MKTNDLLKKAEDLQAEIKEAVVSKGVDIPANLVRNIEKNKNGAELLRQILKCADASVGLDIRETLSDHYKIGFTSISQMDLWDKASKEKIKAALINKIHSVKLKKSHDELFFEEGFNATDEIRNETVQKYQEIAVCAIEYTFAEVPAIKPSLNVKAFKAILSLCELPGAYPSDGVVSMRNRISLSRLQDITNSEKDSSSKEALFKVAREWYQNSKHDFLEHKCGYHQYTYVPFYLHILTENQLEKVRTEFLEDAEKYYKELKAAEWNRETEGSIEFLINKIKEILSWKVLTE